MEKKIKAQEQRVKQLKDDAKKNKVEYPKWWPKEQLIALKYGDYKLVELDMKTNETAKEVITSFNKTAGNKVVKIEGVMNQMLFDKWWNEKQMLLKLIGQNKINQRNLFHGTKTEDVMKFILK